ncbi:hypothetical protein MLD38_010058 [Melastoma candidum]|uniref:Uncharacterized protein n=1 Tax=Melastoma candidum TaxID=119954 RepID=A0ACB9QY57_9MYRT|nr:hypothetical protein MLD38_010058 [Melastoma candidum]
MVLLPTILLSLFFSSLPDPVRSQELFPQPKCSSMDGTFPAGGPVASNLDTLVASINGTSLSVLEDGFFNVSKGQLGSDYAAVQGLCHPDLTFDDCRACLSTSGSQIRQYCSDATHAVLYNENCTIRYSNVSIYGTMAAAPVYCMPGVYNATNQTKQVPEVMRLLRSLRDKAASGGPLLKYSTDQGTVDSDTLYGMVQCTPDLSDQQCSDCLTQIFGLIPQCCEGKIGGRIFAPSCQFRFETNFRFYGLIPTYPPSPSKSKRKTTWIVISSSTASAILVIVIFLFLIWKKRKYWRRRPLISEETDEISSAESLQFDLSIIRAATNNFSDANKLGEGGFGSVFMGKLANGRGIAVKQLSTDSSQGEMEFKNEVKLLARLQHRNLVRLLGFCLGQAERLLIYELVRNSSLDKFIFDPLKRTYLDWDSRYKIIRGLVRGLIYLHEDSRLRIIHRDLKASNILLDEDMNPKISDFGMARLFSWDQTQADTRRIVGTYGYMAPEYAMHGHFSVKSDVFSFGVLVLETVSGRRSQDLQSGFEILLNHKWKNWREGSITNIIDPLMRMRSTEEVLSAVAAGIRREYRHRIKDIFKSR